MPEKIVKGKKCQVFIDPEIHRNIKILASSRGVSLKEFADRLFQTELKKAGKKNEVSVG